MMEAINKNLGYGNGRAKTSRHVLKSLQAKADLKRTIPEKIADWATGVFGSVTFLSINTFWFIAWIVTNLGFIPDLRVFDPFPFGLLTMTVSLEAIILSIFVLISQNRANKIDDLREKMVLQFDIITEQEVTKILELVKLLAEKNGINVSHDKTIQEMLRPVDVDKIESMLERQIEE